MKNEINSIFFTLALNFKHYNLIKFKRSRNFLYLRQALGYGQGMCFWCFHKPLVENSLCTGKKNTISMLEEIEYKVRKGFSSNRIETNIRLCNLLKKNIETTYLGLHLCTTYAPTMSKFMHCAGLFSRQAVQKQASLLA